jgi:hypothetical protein
MLNVVFRLAAPWACAWAVWLPAAHAAEADAATAATAALSAPFAHYQGWRDEPLQDWREANDRVGEIGGWRTYLREAQPDGDGDDQEGAHHGH